MLSFNFFNLYMIAKEKVTHSNHSQTFFSQINPHTNTPIHLQYVYFVLVSVFYWTYHESHSRFVDA